MGQPTGVSTQNRGHRLSFIAALRTNVGTEVRNGSFATRSCQQQSGHVRSALKAEVLCQLLWVDRATRDVFQAPKLEPWIVRYELSDAEWAIIKPFLPNKSRGVRRVNDRQVLKCEFYEFTA